MFMETRDIVTVGYPQIRLIPLSCREVGTSAGGRNLRRFRPTFSWSLTGPSRDIQL